MAELTVYKIVETTTIIRPERGEFCDHSAAGNNLAVRDAITDEIIISNHRVFDAFGNLLSETAGGETTIFGYAGREWEEVADLQFNRARWYDPTIGRWISQDPIGFAAGDANLYRYVLNRATTLTDPSGLQPPGLPFGPPPHPIRPPFMHLNSNNCYTGFTANNEPVPDRRSPATPARPDTRPLTRGEIEMLVSVFGNHLDMDELVVGTVPLHRFHGGNSITPRGIPWMAPGNYVDDYSQLPAGSGLRGHFIHEFTHVLQHQQGNWNHREALWLWASHGFRYGRAYHVDPNDLGRPLYSFNMEQQASIVEYVYMGYYTGDNLDRALQTIDGFQTQCPPPTWPYGHPGL